MMKRDGLVRRSFLPGTEIWLTPRAARRLDTAMRCLLAVVCAVCATRVIWIIFE